MIETVAANAFAKLLLNSQFSECNERMHLDESNSAINQTWLQQVWINAEFLNLWLGLNELLLELQLQRGIKARRKKRYLINKLKLQSWEFSLNQTSLIQSIQAYLCSSWNKLDCWFNWMFDWLNADCSFMFSLINRLGWMASCWSG